MRHNPRGPSRRAGNPAGAFGGRPAPTARDTARRSFHPRKARAGKADRFREGQGHCRSTRAARAGRYRSRTLRAAEDRTPQRRRGRARQAHRHRYRSKGADGSSGNRRNGTTEAVRADAPHVDGFFRKAPGRADLCPEQRPEVCPPNSGGRGKRQRDWRAAWRYSWAVALEGSDGHVGSTSQEIKTPRGTESRGAWLAVRESSESKLYWRRFSMRIPSWWKSVRVRQMTPTTMAPRRPSKPAAAAASRKLPTSSPNSNLFAFMSA